MGPTAPQAHPAGGLDRTRRSSAPHRGHRHPSRRGEAAVRRVNKPVWLWWSGTRASAADLDRCWQSFLRRFDREHTFHLLKQTLGWARPRLRSSDAADRWTWLVIAVYARLRLARPLATDLRRPPGRDRPNRTGLPPLASDGSSETCARRPALQPAHRDPQRPLQGGYLVRRTAVRPPITTWVASSRPARHTAAPPITKSTRTTESQRRSLSDKPMRGGAAGENDLLPVPLAWSALQGHSVEGMPVSPGSRRCPGRLPNFSAGSRLNTKKAGARRSISQEHLGCNNAN